MAVLHTAQGRFDSCTGNSGILESGSGGAVDDPCFPIVGYSFDSHPECSGKSSGECWRRLKREGPSTVCKTVAKRFDSSCQLDFLESVSLGTGSVSKTDSVSLQGVRFLTTLFPALPMGNHRDWHSRFKGSTPTNSIWLPSQCEGHTPAFGAGDRGSSPLLGTIRLRERWSRMFKSK